MPGDAGLELEGRALGGLLGPLEGQVDEPLKEVRAVVVGVGVGPERHDKASPVAEKGAELGLRVGGEGGDVFQEHDIGRRPAEREQRRRCPRLGREPSGAIAAGIERQRGESRWRRPIPRLRDPEHAEGARRPERRVPAIVRRKRVLVGLQDNRSRRAGRIGRAPPIERHRDPADLVAP